MQLGLSLTALNKPITAFKAGGASEGAVSSLPMPSHGYCPTGYAASGNTCYLVRTESSGGSGRSGGSNSVKVNTTVSPNITVSPQISPVFQQQFQPSNSPMQGGTSQSAHAPSAADVARERQMQLELETVRAQLALEQARKEAPRTTSVSVTEPALPPPLSQGLPPAGAPAPAPVSAPLPANFAPPPLEQLISSNTALNTGSANVSADDKKPIDIKLLLVALGLGAVLLLGVNSDKKRGTRNAR